MTALSDIQAQLDQTAGIIDSFKHSITDGALIDMTGLDRSVEEICAAIAELPADQRVTVKETLITILDSLNGLVESLEEQQQDASDGLKGLASRQQAVSAYGKGNVAAQPGKPQKDEGDK